MTRRPLLLGIRRGSHDLADDGESVPCLDCPSCGAWASSGRLRVRLTAVARRLIDRVSVPLAEWPEFRRKLARSVGVKAERIKPGMTIGEPEAELLARDQCMTETVAGTEDLIEPFPGQFWGSDRFVEAVRGLSGLELWPATLRGARRRARAMSWTEAVVLGSCRGPGYDAWKRAACRFCGRRKKAPPPVVDVRTVVSDFSILDENPARVILSPRAAEALQDARLRNLALEPIRTVGA